jgi:hypothetical protein
MRTWPGLLLVPLLALTHLTLNYALVPWSCRAGEGALHAVALASLVLALGITFYQCAVWRRSAEVPAGAAMVSRQRFLAGVSALAAGYFTLVIAALWSAQWVIPACIT